VDQDFQKRGIAVEYLLCSTGLFAFAAFIAWMLCRAAAIGDRMSEAARNNLEGRNNDNSR
jgi:hypothetical protein